MWDRKTEKYTRKETNGTGGNGKRSAARPKTPGNWLSYRYKSALPTELYRATRIFASQSSCNPCSCIHIYVRIIASLTSTAISDHFRSPPCVSAIVSCFISSSASFLFFFFFFFFYVDLFGFAFSFLQHSKANWILLNPSDRKFRSFPISHVSRREVLSFSTNFLASFFLV